MANNYLQFSEILSVTTPQQHSWVEGYFEIPEYVNNPPEEGTAEYALLEKWCDERDIPVDDADRWPNFDVEIRDDHVWMSSDEGGEVEQAAAFVAAFYKEFDIAVPFTLTWAETCSKLRVSEFSGGGFIVLPTAAGEDEPEVMWVTPMLFFERVLADWRRE